MPIYHLLPGDIFSDTCRYRVSQTKTTRKAFAASRLRGTRGLTADIDRYDSNG